MISTLRRLRDKGPNAGDRQTVNRKAVSNIDAASETTFGCVSVRTFDRAMRCKVASAVKGMATLRTATLRGCKKHQAAHKDTKEAEHEHPCVEAVEVQAIKGNNVERQHWGTKWSAVKQRAAQWLRRKPAVAQ